MWGRRPGQSVAEHIAELDAERALWARGEAGEVLVGSELEHLAPGEWWVFHAIPRGSAGTDIDHLVVGVGGAFTVNTKNVSGNVWVAKRALMVGGHKTGYLPVAASEARDTSRRMSTCAARTVDVHPLLVFTRTVTIKEMPDDVTVLEFGLVRRWLESRPRVWTPAQAHEIAMIADRPSTWL